MEQGIPTGKRDEKGRPFLFTPEHSVDGVFHGLDPRNQRDATLLNMALDPDFFDAIMAVIEKAAKHAGRAAKHLKDEQGWTNENAISAYGYDCFVDEFRFRLKHMTGIGRVVLTDAAYQALATLAEQLAMSKDTEE